MARAASYYYLSDSSLCVLCHRSSSEEISFKHGVSDLIEDRVLVPCHRRCYRLRRAGFWLEFILIAVSTFLILRFLELGIFYRPRWPWGHLPGALTALDAILGMAIGAAAALRSYFRFDDTINRYVQLNTFPID